MSVAPDCYASSWINCPSDILMLIFKSLDNNSLINCMHVNKTWSDTVYYYCQHYSLWGKLVEEYSKRIGLNYALKSHLNDKDLFLSAQNWLHIQNSKKLPCYNYNFEKIRSMCMCKELLIVTSCFSLSFVDVQQKKMVRRLEFKIYLQYIETESLIAQLTLSNHKGIVYNELTLINKLHRTDCQCPEVPKAILVDISIFKVHVNACYVLDKGNNLLVKIAEGCWWYTKFLARYYGSQESIILIHVHVDDVYMLLRTGDILKVDKEYKKFERLFCLDINHNLLDREFFMFHKYSLLFAVPSEKTIELYPSKEKQQTVIACPGLTCVLEHGPVLITGFENGTVKIFVIDKLLKKEIIPALQFSLQTYMSLLSYEIIAIEVFEDEDGHHLFLATGDKGGRICEFLIEN